EGEPVTVPFFAETLGFAPHEGPRFENAPAQQHPRRGDEPGAHHPPFRQGIEVIIMCPTGPQLDLRRPELAEPRIVMRWPHAPPRILLPDPKGRLPKKHPGVGLD